MSLVSESKLGYLSTSLYEKALALSFWDCFQHSVSDTQ